MRQRQRRFYSFCVMVAAASSFTAVAQTEQTTRTAPDPAAVVDALQAKSGVYQHERRNHTKGVCFFGSFQGTQDASELSRSALFTAKDIPVVGRFSQAGGDLNMPDNKPNPHGMAIRFKLPGNSLLQMAMLDLPFFDAATPAAFLAKQVATTPDPATGKPDPAKIAALGRDYPEFLRLQTALKGKSMIPDGYQHDDFNSLDTFIFENNEKKRTFVRWRFVPVDGVKKIGTADAAVKGKDFLSESIASRLKQGSAQWNMIVTEAKAGDSITDPSQRWQGDHKEIEAGVLTIVRTAPQDSSECGDINYDPTVLSDGVAASEDPVLRFRSPAYAISFGRRIAEPAPK